MATGKKKKPSNKKDLKISGNLVSPGMEPFVRKMIQQEIEEEKRRNRIRSGKEELKPWGTFNVNTMKMVKTKPKKKKKRA